MLNPAGQRPAKYCSARGCQLLLCLKIHVYSVFGILNEFHQTATFENKLKVVCFISVINTFVTCAVKSRVYVSPPFLSFLFVCSFVWVFFGGGGGARL